MPEKLDWENRNMGFKIVFVCMVLTVSFMFMACVSPWLLCSYAIITSPTPTP